jgi:hypothetical protein
MAIQSNFPALRPSLNLDFSNTKTLDPRVTFARASEARYYDGKTFAKAEENLLLRSQEFNDAGWTKQALSVTANTEVAPDGTTTAYTITLTAGGGVHAAIQTYGAFTGGRVISVFAKAGTHGFIQLSFNGDATPWANFTITAGVGAVGSVGTNQTATIVDVGNGWYRCVVYTASTTATNFYLTVVSASTAARQESWTAAGTETVFLWGAQLEQRSAVTAYTPTTTQPITNYIPQLMTAASGVARFDHNPVTGESLGLLIEEQRANLVLQSEDFTTTWAATRATVGANSVVAPTGALTADRLIDNTDNNTHFVSQNVTTSAVAMTFSVFAKASGRSFVYLSINDSGNVARTTFFNLSTGAVGTTGTGITASIVPVGNGWYRCIVTVATAFAGSNPCVIGVASADNTASYAGNGFYGVAIWGAQVE